MSRDVALERLKIAARELLECHRDRRIRELSALDRYALAWARAEERRCKRRKRVREEQP